MGQDEVTSYATAARARGDLLTDILNQWASVGIIGPEWGVHWDDSKHWFRCRFTLLRGDDLPPVLYDLNETDMSAYVMGATDWARTSAGPAAEQLANEDRGLT